MDKDSGFSYGVLYGNKFAILRWCPYKVNIFLKRISYAGGDIFRIACTFLGHDLIPLVETAQPKYSISCFLMLHFSELNLISAVWARLTVSSRRISCRSSVELCTFTSSAQGNVPGMPAIEIFRQIRNDQRGDVQSNIF